MSYQQALQDIKLGYYEAAIAKLDPLLQADPSQPKLWYAKALALVNLQGFWEAITMAELSVGLKPSFAAGYQLLGNACTQPADKKRAISEGLLGQNYLWRYDVRILQTEVELYLR